MTSSAGRLIAAIIFAMLTVGVWLAIAANSRTGQQRQAISTATDLSAAALVTPSTRITPSVAVDQSAQLAIQTAINEIQILFPLLSGTPAAIHAQLVTIADLPFLGITSVPSSASDDTLFWLVVIHGDFYPGERNISPQNAEHPGVDYVLALVSQRWNRVAYMRLAPNMYGLGCVFKDPSLPGGYTACSGELLHAALHALQTPRPTPWPTGAAIRGYSPEDARAIREQYDRAVATIGPGAVITIVVGTPFPVTGGDIPGQQSPAVGGAMLGATPMPGSRPVAVATATTTPTAGPSPTRDPTR